jgi:thiamine biosynthesis lipoprotein
MGTVYMVKISDPPADLPEDWRQQVDLELRRVNDQMSTYLESSELSRFNRSSSTDWFPVSPETATVVAYALDVSAATDGAFDVTVGPLVDAWSFGPGERSETPPDDAKIAQLRERVGYQRLAVRRDPPALKKQQPALRVDLSAIAKGHGVDRVIERLTAMGVENAFVEIGGEVRVQGARGPRPWGVGIQQPDAESGRVLTAVPLTTGAIATSGDYRNYFEKEGERFSHTLDPRTGRPITHRVASVSVHADHCMAADAWATAINVLGAEAGAEVAAAEGLDILMLVRTDEGFTPIRTGIFASPEIP